MRDADEVAPEVREVRDPREVQIVDQGGLLDVVHDVVRRKDDVVLLPAERDPFEEFLVEWITLGGKKNNIVDNIKKSALIYNLNLAWIPNFSNLWSDFVRVPHH